MKKQPVNVIKILLVILITTVACLLMLPFFQNYQALKVSKIQVTTYRHTLPKKIQTTETIHGLALSDLVNLQGKNHDAIGNVLIPRIGLYDNIYTGLTNGNLAIGAVTLFPERSPENHNVVLIGHNMGFKSIHFGVLSTVRVHDNIFLNYLNHYCQYTVSSVETIKETNLDKIADTNDSILRLITCSSAQRTPNRILVSAKLAQKLEKQDLTSVLQKTNRENNKQMNISLMSHVWLPILLIIFGYIVMLWIVLKLLTELK